MILWFLSFIDGGGQMWYCVEIEIHLKMNEVLCILILFTLKILKFYQMPFKIVNEFQLYSFKRVFLILIEELGWKDL